MDHRTCLIPGEKDLFLDANDELLCQLKDLVMPLESIAPQVFQAIYQRQQAEISWITLTLSLHPPRPRPDWRVQSNGPSHLVYTS